jgi:hypothetical protein
MTDYHAQVVQMTKMLKALDSWFEKEERTVCQGQGVRPGRTAAGASCARHVLIAAPDISHVAR